MTEGKAPRVQVEQIDSGDPRLLPFACPCGRTHELRRCCLEPRPRYIDAVHGERGFSACAIFCESCGTALVQLNEPPG